MKRKRNFQTKIYLTLRQLGMLCKKSKPSSKRIHISKTLLSNGIVRNYDQPPLKEEILMNQSSIDSEIHSWIEWKKGYNSLCKFSGETKSCVCGKTMDEFLTRKCKL